VRPYRANMAEPALSRLEGDSRAGLLALLTWTGRDEPRPAMPALDYLVVPALDYLVVSGPAAADIDE
jgi:hypothetical protein